MSFKEQMKEKVVQIEAIIGQYLPEEKGFQKTLFEKSQPSKVNLNGC